MLPFGVKCRQFFIDKECTEMLEGSKTNDDPQPGLDNNPGKDAKLFADSHPYIANAAKGAWEAVKEIVNTLDLPQNYAEDKTYGKRFLVSKVADKTELVENTRAARALVASFKDMRINITPHLIADGHKNPEYTINGLTADRKGIMSEKGITSAFKKAIEHGCLSVVID